MSSFNNVRKIKYFRDPDAVVALEEYIVFEDERAEEKFVVFKFVNNISQQLLGMEFEVSQYGADGELVEKSVAIYNKFLAKPNKSFVPNAKLKVNYLTRTISVRLIKAAFDRFLWKEGEYLDNSYKFEHYAKDRDFVFGKASAPSPQSPQPQKIKQTKRKKYLPFKAKNATRKNIPKFPGVLNGIICVIIFVAIFLAIYFFPKTSDRITVDAFNLHIINSSDNTAAVYGYRGKDKDVTIPAEIGGYKVIRLDSGAFKDSYIQSVSFATKSMTIESGAFENCASLVAVSSEPECESITVKSGAFGCASLSGVYLPQAYLFSGSFTGCNSVTYMSFYGTQAKTLSELFGGTVPVGLKEENVECGTELPEDFYNINGKPEEYDPEKDYTYGELENFNLSGYKKYDSCETLNGVIITVNTSTETFVVPEGTNGVSSQAAAKLSGFSGLTVETEYLPNEVYDCFTGVNEILLTDNVKRIDRLAFSKMNSLEALDTPYFSYKTMDEMFGKLASLKRLYVRPSEENNSIPDTAFHTGGLPSIEELFISDGFTSCGRNIIYSSSTLNYIRLPLLDYRYSIIGIDCTRLSTVDIAFASIPENYCNINLSYAYTSNLTVLCSDLNYGFLRYIVRLDNLTLNYLQAPTCTLYDVFGSSFNRSIGTFTLNCPEYIDNSFTGNIKIDEFVNNSGNNGSIVKI
ncbi:MAG: leucine-rich repeat protein [Clostridia bacterium]|nr:leucine-rich repeat protein [Clostridia bacterium]